MNAIQHCAQGSIIKVSITREGDQVRVAVANPGEPIESAVLDHLFDRFYRAEVSRTNSRENHGLGLAIVKATAEMHGGKVSVTSVGGINTFAFSVAASGSGQASAPGTPAVNGPADAPSGGPADVPSNAPMHPASASH
jgi:two-component system heavy metal sensor histidine kinase CusS